jgi:Asp-tRNA(Asn)/Glu-tRNA(Gln) amidotransferase A subunit family amidase
VPCALKDIGQYLEGTKQARLVILGKTNLPELELTTTTESVLFGETHNP